MRICDLKLGSSTRTIASIMSDSREHMVDAMFFCLKGITVDSHKFVDQAIKNGAILIIHSLPLEKVDGVNYFLCEDVLKEYQRVCPLFYDYPGQKLNLIGVTGTNGKTTISSLLQSIGSHFQPAGCIGTNGYQYKSVIGETDFTTPLLHSSLAILNEMVTEGVTLCAMETSSEALHQKRTKTLPFKIAIFTNLTRDHLNYHQTMENYLKAKKILFDDLSKESFALVNKEDPSYKLITQDTQAKLVTYGCDVDADIVATNIKLSPYGTQFTCRIFDDVYDIKTNLIAKFNVSNLLAVLGSFALLGYPMDEVVSLLQNVDEIKGRININHVNDVFVIVDYAHTPDGFIQLFKYAQSIKAPNSTIWAVFGSAGKRDKGKRPILGEIASHYANQLILTEEDARDENPYEIAVEIKSGVTKEDVKINIVIDRYEAIEYAITHAAKGDIVLILGKGTETFLDRAKSDFWMSDTVAVEKVKESLNHIK